MKLGTVFLVTLLLACTSNAAAQTPAKDGVLSAGGID
jgi:hypothetical protein